MSPLCLDRLLFFWRKSDDKPPPSVPEMVGISIDKPITIPPKWEDWSGLLLGILDNVHGCSQHECRGKWLGHACKFRLRREFTQKKKMVLTDLAMHLQI